MARQVVARFRVNYARNSEDPRFPALIERCRQSSILFRELWAHHDVLEQEPLSVRYDHPKVGPLHFSSTSFQAIDAPDLHLVLFTPMPDTGTATEIERLVHEEITREVQVLSARTRLARASA